MHLFCPESPKSKVVLLFQISTWIWPGAGPGKADPCGNGGMGWDGMEQLCLQVLLLSQALTSLCTLIYFYSFTQPSAGETKEYQEHSLS